MEKIKTWIYAHYSEYDKKGEMSATPRTDALKRKWSAAEGARELEGTNEAE